MDGPWCVYPFLVASWAVLMQSIELHHYLNPVTNFPGIRTSQSDVYAFACTALEVGYRVILFYSRAHDVCRFGLAWRRLQDIQTRALYSRLRPRAGTRHVPRYPLSAGLDPTRFGPFSKRAGTWTLEPGLRFYQSWRTCESWPNNGTKGIYHSTV